MRPLQTLVFNLAALHAGALLLAAPIAAQKVVGQVAVPDSSRMVAMMASSMRLLKPAQFLLDHRMDLALTPEQVPFLEALAVAQADSIPVRQARTIALMVEATAKRRGSPSATVSAMSWSGAFDEKALRDMACEQSVLQAESLINLARDRHAAAAALTPAQVAMIPRLEASDMSRVLRPRAAPGASLPPAGGVYFEFQVDKPVVQLPSGAVKYPDELRASKTRGEVLAQFVVGTDGLYEPSTFKVLRSDHQLFTRAVRDALPLMRFEPAQVAGAKVRQMVQQPFTFSLPDD
ncbi:MAG: TonB family protein [bacterium]